MRYNFQSTLDKRQWHRWYAWRPVVVTREGDRESLVWLENLWRRYLSAYGEFYPSYRLASEYNPEVDSW